MDSRKIEQFITLAGQSPVKEFHPGDEKKRKLGAQLLLSEVLEYVIHGLGVVPHVNGTPILDPNKLEYVQKDEPDELEMLDGLADVAYTMFWNAVAFGLPLPEAFELVCDNNLEKFVSLPGWQGAAGELAKEAWDCGADVAWPPEVARVEVLKVGEEFFAVGKDKDGKVRKPLHYKPVDLQPLLSGSQGAGLKKAVNG